MTDERMTQGGARLREEEWAILLEPCACGHPMDDHGSIAGCWHCPDDGGECAVRFETLLTERMGRIVAARVGEVVERVEAACKEAELRTQESRGYVSDHWRGRDYADGLDAGIETTADLVRDALRAADAPLSDVERDGGRGGAGDE